VKTKRFRSIILSLLGVGFAAALIYYLYINADQYLKLLNVSAKGVILLFVLTLAFPLLTGLQYTFLYRNLSTMKFSHRDGYLLAAAATLANQLPVPGGIISKGFYLKYKYNISYTKFTSSTIALFFCYLSVNGVVGICSLLYGMLFRNVIASPVLWVGYALMAASFLFFLLPLNPNRIKISNKMRNRISQALEGWEVLSENPKLLLNLIGLQIILMVLLAFRYLLAFRMLSQSVTFDQTLLFASASILTQLVSIAPGGLGIRETIVGAVAAILGVDPVVSVVAVGLDRLVATVVIVLTGGISTMMLGKQVSDVSINLEKQEL
jgi:uncharacterized membrane protein YbhN (UPF0104 family)